MHIYVLFLIYVENVWFSGQEGRITFLPGGQKSQLINISIDYDSDKLNEILVITFYSSDLPPNIMLDLPSPQVVITNNNVGELGHIIVYPIIHMFNAIFC